MIADITITSLQTIQWEFQDPKMEVPTIYKAYVSEYHRKIWLLLLLPVVPHKAVAEVSKIGSL